MTGVKLETSGGNCPPKSRWHNTVAQHTPTDGNPHGDAVPHQVSIYRAPMFGGSSAHSPSAFDVTSSSGTPAPIAGLPRRGA